MLISRLVLGQLQANCYIIVDEPTACAAVIDPGDDAPTISRMIIESGAKLTHILLTHGHTDHMFAAGTLQEEFPDAAVLVHKADADQLFGNNLNIAAQYYDMRLFKPFRPAAFVEDGQLLRIGEMEVSVVHTPGHTQGSVCYRAGHVLFTGDTIFARGVGRTDLPGGSYEKLVQSIQEKIVPLSDETAIYPGHGSESTVGEEKRFNPWLLEWAAR